MSREFRTRGADRPALLGDRDHTHRVALRAAIVTFIAMLLVLSPLAYALGHARLGRIGQFGMTDAVLVGVVIILVALATAFAVMVVIHLLGREARARRRR